MLNICQAGPTGKSGAKQTLSHLHNIAYPRSLVVDKRKTASPVPVSLAAGLAAGAYTRPVSGST